MSKSAATRIENFIRKAASVEHEEGPLAGLQLWRVDQRSLHSIGMLETWQYEGEDASTIADEILIAAQEETDAVETAATFRVRACYGPSDEAQLDGPSFRLRSAHSQAIQRAHGANIADPYGAAGVMGMPTGSGDEQPIDVYGMPGSAGRNINDVGVELFSKLMVHVEALQRMNIGLAAQTNQALIAENRRLSETNERLEENRMAFVQMIEELHDRKSERNIAEKAEEHKLERKQQLWEQLTAVLPFFANRIGAKLLSKGGNPLKLLDEDEGMTPFEAQLFQFMGTLAPDQIGKMTEALDPAQQATLLTMYDAIRDKHSNMKQKQGEKREARKEKLAEAAKKKGRPKKSAGEAPSEAKD